MRDWVSCDRYSTVSRLALIGLIGSLAGACSSDTLRFAGDPFANPFANPFAATSAKAGEPSATGALPDEPVAAAPRSIVTAQALPPPQTPLRTSAAQAPVYNQPPAVAKPSAVASRAASGPAGWSAQGGSAVTVGTGEGINTLANRYGVPAQAILTANGLVSASQVIPGRQVVIPVYSASGGPAPTAAAKTAAQPKMRLVEGPKPAVKAEPAKVAEPKRPVAPAAPVVVKPAIVQPIAAAKPQAPVEPAPVVVKAAPAPVKAAPVVVAKPSPVVTATTKPAPVVAAKPAKVEAVAPKPAPEPQKVARVEPAPAKPAEVKAATVQPVASAKPAPVTKPVAAVAPSVPPAPAAPPKEPEQTASVAQPSAEFRWPARGRVINGFGSSGNEGINIAVPEGTPVKAAESGTVAYAGSEVKGYGNLVLIRHENGYVSAYAHNGELAVKRGEKVKRGQVVAKAGQTGNVTSPQLHFEIRKGPTPVDPMPYLSGN